jgi:type II secretory pathway pseudopilin PulG
MELLIVIVLIGVLAAFLWPDFGILMRSEQLDESVQRSKALIGMCRAQAMNESRRYRVTLLPDGRMLLGRQRDPLLAPEEFVVVAEGWARMEWLLEDVWVAAVLPLPDGPPPLLVEDDKIEFFEVQEFPEPLENPFHVEFEPDGTCTSLRWVLRDTSGHGRELTLDGRLGRVSVIEMPPVSPDELERPARQPEFDELVLADPGIEP